MQKGDIAYKVVEKRTRLCTNLVIFKQYVQNHEALKLNKRYPLLFPRYRKGKVLEADERTEGFFVFEDKSHAEWFIVREGLPKHNVKILRVRLLDEPKRPVRVVSGCGSLPLNVCKMLRSPGLLDVLPPFPGTWACHKVEVLD